MIADIAKSTIAKAPAPSLKKMRFLRHWVRCLSQWPIFSPMSCVTAKLPDLDGPQHLASRVIWYMIAFFTVQYAVS